jgi:hypothetical protein
MLKRLEDHVASGEPIPIPSETLRLLKDSKDRGLGAPIQTVEHRSVSELSDEVLEKELEDPSRQV